MKLLLLVALAFPLGCLALLTFLALLGVLTLRGALRGVAQSGRAWAKLGAANSLDH
jgi:hypothetical protein